MGTGKKEEDKNNGKQDSETTLKTAGLRSSHAYPIGHLAIISALLFPGDTEALRVDNTYIELVCFSFLHLLHTKVTFYHPYFDPRYFPQPFSFQCEASYQFSSIAFGCFPFHYNAYSLCVPGTLLSPVGVLDCLQCEQLTRMTWRAIT